MRQNPALNRRYQKGTLEKLPTRDGMCYYLRYFERFADGTSKRSRLRIGLVAELKNRRDLEDALRPLRERINGKPMEAPKTVAELIARYRREEMPTRYSTRTNYECIIGRHIVPKWGSLALADVDPADVRLWLRSLPLASKTRGHIHELLRVMFRFALLWKWLEGENPMALFRLENSQKRARRPTVLNLEELKSVFAKIDLAIVKIAVVIAAVTGLRRSELFALKWLDIDWMDGSIAVRRGIVDGNVDDVKTEASEASIPMHPLVADLFRALRSDSGYQDDSDWVFASPRSHGKMPWDPGGLQQRHIRPAGIAAGLGNHIGWHTLRHSFRAMLQKNKVSLADQRDLLRHADIRTTANIYGEIRLEELRDASAEVVRGVLQ